jgi:ribosomal RNA-processing protein 12
MVFPAPPRLSHGRPTHCADQLPSANQETQPNAYLLPLIPNHHPTPLSHFVAHFIPLSESLWELAEKSEKDAEKKVYRVLMEQIWNAFPSYCRGAWDIRQVNMVSLSRLTKDLPEKNRR